MMPLPNTVQATSPEKERSEPFVRNCAVMLATPGEMTAAFTSEYSAFMFCIFIFPSTLPLIQASLSTGERYAWSATGQPGRIRSWLPYRRAESIPSLKEAEKPFPCTTTGSPWRTETAGRTAGAFTEASFSTVAGNHS